MMYRKNLSIRSSLLSLIANQIEMVGSHLYSARYIVDNGISITLHGSGKYIVQYFIDSMLHAINQPYSILIRLKST